MIILKLWFAAVFLFALHQFLLVQGGSTGAHLVTAAAAFMTAVVIGLTKESFL